MPIIELEIPDAMYPEIKELILGQNPVPVDDNGDPTMSEDDWVLDRIKQTAVSRFAHMYQAKQQKEIQYEPGRFNSIATRRKAVVARP